MCGSESATSVKESGSPQGQMFNQPSHEFSNELASQLRSRFQLSVNPSSLLSALACSCGPFSLTTSGRPRCFLNDRITTCILKCRKMRRALRQAVDRPGITAVPQLRAAIDFFNGDAAGAGAACDGVYTDFRIQRIVRSTPSASTASGCQSCSEWTPSGQHWVPGRPRRNRFHVEQ